MKYLLLSIIYIYWFLIPKSKRNRCLFKISCSHYVFNITQTQGLIKGLKALNYRFENCREGSEIFINPLDGTTQLILKTNQVIEECDIATHLLQKEN